MQLALLIITAGAAVGTFLAAVGAFRSAKATKLAAQGNLFISLFRFYSSKEMYNAIKILAEVSIRQEDGSDYWGTMVDHFKENRKDLGYIDGAYPGVNEARRSVVHYFLTVLELYQIGECINERFLRHICQTQCLGLAYGVAEHLDQALNPKYGREQFDQLLNFCPEQRRKEYERIRPKA